MLSRCSFYAGIHLLFMITDIHQSAHHCVALFALVLSIYTKTKFYQQLKMLRQTRANILVSTVACQSPWWLIYTGSFTSKLKSNCTTTELLCTMRKLWNKFFCNRKERYIWQLNWSQTTRWKAFGCLLVRQQIFRTLHLPRCMFLNWPIK